MEIVKRACLLLRAPHRGALSQVHLIRKLSNKLSNAANVTHCGRLTTTYRSYGRSRHNMLVHMLVLAQGIEP
jgi:hypothetical protein